MSPEESVANASAVTLRQHILDRYVSTNVGPHQRLSDRALRSYVRAYRYYLRDWVPSVTDGRWLDLGCGQGALMHAARALGYAHVSGVDVSDEMLEACRSRGLSVERADLWDYLANAVHDRWQVVSAFDVLEHFPREDGFRLLVEIRRLLAPGGVCLLKLPNAASPWGGLVHASDLTHETLYAPLSVRQLAVLAGFVRAEVREVGPAPVTTRGILRSTLWRGVRALYQARNLVETGETGGGVYTQVMLARLLT